MQVIKGAELTSEMIAAQPERYQVLANGAVYDHGVKHIVKAPPAELQTFTNQENARQAITSRWVAAQEAAITGLARVGGSDSALAAWSNITERQGDLAQLIEKGRSSTEAARFVGQATGFLRDRADVSTQQQPTDALTGVELADLRDLLGKLRAWKQENGVE